MKGGRLLSVTPSASWSSSLMKNKRGKKKYSILVWMKTHTVPNVLKQLCVLCYTQWHGEIPGNVPERTDAYSLERCWSTSTHRRLPLRRREGSKYCWHRNNILWKNQRSTLWLLAWIFQIFLPPLRHGIAAENSGCLPHHRHPYTLFSSHLFEQHSAARSQCIWEK